MYDLKFWILTITVKFKMLPNTHLLELILTVYIFTFFFLLSNFEVGWNCVAKKIELVIIQYKRSFNMKKY